MRRSHALPLFFFNAPAPTEIYTLSLHDALPISPQCVNPIYEERMRDALLAQKEIGVHCVAFGDRSEEHTSELQSRGHLVCRLLLEKKKKTQNNTPYLHEAITV